MSRADWMFLTLRSSLPFWLSAAATFAFALVIHTIWWQTQHYFPSPIYDDIFDRLRFYRAASHWNTLLAYLVAPHNEHRITTTRIVEIFDETLFSGREVLQVVVTNTLQMLGAIGSFLLFRRFVGRSWSLIENIFVAALLLLLFINANFFYTLIVPFQIQHTIMATLCLAAAALMALASEKRDTNVSVRWLVPALVVIAILASFTIGNAPVILLAVAGTSLILRWRPRLIGLLVVLAITHAVVMFLTTPTTGTRTYDPIVILKFLVLYLGGPFIRVDPGPRGM